MSSQIMDPKMDSGLLIPDKDAAVDNFDPLQNMLPEEIIGIMDQLLSFEVCLVNERKLIINADMISRWPGTKDTHSPRHYSLVCTCTLY